MTFHHDPFPKVHCLLARAERRHLTVISVSVSASCQTQFTVSLFHCVPAFFWFLVSAAVLASNTRAAQILWLVGSAHTVLGYIASIIGTCCWCRTVAKTTGWSSPLPDWKEVTGCRRPVQLLQYNVAWCYVKEERESVFTVVENECHHLLQSSTLSESRVKIFFGLSIVEVRIEKWLHMNYCKIK